jgi:pyridoxal phosphate enzyme (YggS family)
LFPSAAHLYTVRLTFSGGAGTRDLASLSNRLEDVRERIARAVERSGRPAGSVRLLAVSKGIDAERVGEAFRLGAVELGESRVQEAEPKIALVGPGPRWHLVGHLQTNKAKRAALLFDAIHSIDSERLADEIGRRAAEAGRTLEAYVEVNTSGDPGKHGVAPEEAPALIERVAAIRSLRAAGLMTIGPLEGGEAGARASFRALRRIRDEAVARGTLAPDAGLSMGMTDDFEAAIEEGATIVRVGSAIFGTDR